LAAALNICVSHIKTVERLTKVSHRALSQLSEAAEDAFPEVRSGVMKDCLQRIRMVAPYNTPVLLQGESGTGKEVLARYLHKTSSRRKRPFLSVNCAAIPENLIESTLFGHRKGAFTGAVSDNSGFFERARGGTLFLDEIGDLSLNAQAKILRVLETEDFERVGGVEQKQADVRIVAASHKTIKNEVENGNFRRDLFFRISSFPVIVPPLRDRKEDIIPLAELLLKDLCRKMRISFEGYGEAFNRELLQHSWPGNIRELKNELEKALIISGGRKLDLQIDSQVEFKNESFEDRVKEIIVGALKTSGGKVQGEGGAAELLSMNSQTLYSKIRKYSISL
jgi:transcriptional regulator with GAF, ATPase, and Fis domain